MPPALVLAPLAAVLFLYLPGHYLLRRATGRLRGSLLFREVLLSVSCTTWFAFVLAELGI